MTPQVIIAIIIVLIAAVAGVVAFIKLPQEKKIANIKEWLKLAVVEAEKALGSGPGQLKLRYVYDKAVQQFPWIVSLIPFETFGGWVDEALEWMKKQVEQNKNVIEYIAQN